MAKLKDFLTLLAKKAGFDTESATAKPFFDAIPDTEVPEDVSKGIDNALISLTEAKNNHPELKNHYVAPALNGMDKEFATLMEDFKLDDAIKAEILAEKSTYKRGPLLTRKIVELERQKVSSTSGKDKQEIQKQIDELQASLASTKQGWENDKKSFEQQRIQDKINVKKNVFFSGMKTIHDGLDPETRYTILDSQFQKALQDSNAKLTLDDNGNVVLLRNDGTNYFGENHQQVKPEQFIEQVLAKNKQLVVSQTTGANGATNNNGANGATHSQPASSGGGNGKQEQSQSAAINRNLQAIQDYENAERVGAFGV